MCESAQDVLFSADYAGNILYAFGKCEVGVEFRPSIFVNKLYIFLSFICWSKDD